MSDYVYMLREKWHSICLLLCRFIRTQLSDRVFASKWTNTLISMNELRINFHVLKYSIEFPFANGFFPPHVDFPRLVQFTRCPNNKRQHWICYINQISISTTEWSDANVTNPSDSHSIKNFRNNEQAQNKTETEQNRAEPHQSRSPLNFWIK